MNKTHKPKLALLASGSGSNVEKIIEYAQQNDSYKVELIVSSSPKAKVLDRARNHDIPSVILDRNDFRQNVGIVEQLSGVDAVILAGFLWLIPEYLIEAFPDRILNIHPSLLPKYGGKGMYGRHVHEAVLKAKETYSGITIHLVNREYDKGRRLFQASTPIVHCKNTDEVASEVQKLEHKYFPYIIDLYLQS